MLRYLLTYLQLFMSGKTQEWVDEERHDTSQGYNTIREGNIPDALVRYCFCSYASWWIVACFEIGAYKIIKPEES